METVAAEARWYALQIRHHCEKKALTYLSRKGLGTFLPSRVEIRRWSDRKRTIEVPLFSGYGFVYASLADSTRLQVLQTEGVLGFVNHQGKAMPIPEKQIHDLRLLTTQKMPCTVHVSLQAGQRVRVRGGCLDGIEGTLTAAHDDRMFISLDVLNRSVAVSITGYKLEPA